MKRYFIVLILIFIPLFISCDSTNNEIYNKSYDVDININDISQAFIPAIEKASESIVGISAYGRNTIIASWQLASTGSGVVYKATATTNDGEIIDDISTTKDRDDIVGYTYWVITNQHVIFTNARQEKIKVYLGEENLLIDANVLGYDVIQDLAVVTFSSSIYITPIEITDSDKIKKGELVLAIGNSEGYEYYSTATLGIVSYSKRYVSVKRDIDLDGKDETTVSCEFIQHDAGINSGNSGGALVNIKGELIGINSMKLVDDESSIEGMGFAIPSNVVQRYIPFLEEGKTYVSFAIKGSMYSINEINNQDIFKDIPEVRLSENFNYDYGVYVYYITNGRFCGLQTNDIILEVNGEKAINQMVVEINLRNMLPGEKVNWKVYRDNAEINLEVTLN